jgi:hypothetical protein
MELTFPAAEIPSVPRHRAPVSSTVLLCRKLVTSILCSRCLQLSAEHVRHVLLQNPVQRGLMLTPVGLNRVCPYFERIAMNTKVVFG